MSEQIKKIQSNNKRIAQNTLMLYLRQVLIMLVGLYTVRVVLKTLGIEDYGVYNVVSGAVTMFGFLSGAMATGSQRFFSFYLGQNDIQNLQKYFHNTLTIYIILSVIIVVLGESIGVWFINNMLIIPENRIIAANYIFQFSILTFIFSILNAPLIAMIMSHEDMGIFAKIGILEVFIKLFVVFLLSISPFDKLISYGFLLLCVSIIIFSIYFIYCRQKYKECTFKIEFEKDTIQEIAGFSGWNLFGSFAWIIKNQGTSFLLNMFFGPAMNAAQNLATQIRTIINTFASNFTSAVQPQIVKYYAQDEYEKMFTLMARASKMSFLLMAMIAIPAILNLEFFLNLWLFEIPDYAIIFTKILLIEATIEAMSTPTASANQATGKIKYYQMVIGVLGLLNLPISYYLLYINYSATAVYITSLLLQSFIVLHRAIHLRHIQKNISIHIIKKVYFPCIIAGAISYYLCYHLFNNSFNIVYIIINCCLETVIVLFIAYLLIFDKYEKKYILNFIRKKIYRK